MSTLFTDTFVRANSTGLGANWTAAPDANSSGFDIVSDKAVPHQTTADCGNIVTAVVWPNDQWAQVTLGVVNTDSGFQGCGVCVRRSASATTFYRLTVNGFLWQLESVVAGVYTQLAYGSPTTVAGDVWYLEFQGTAWKIEQNGTTIQTGTDSSIASGDAGISYSSTDTTASLAGFSGGSFGTSTFTLTAGFGAYGVTGESVTLSSTAFPAALLAASGTYNYIGAPASSVFSLSAATGSYAISGVPALLNFGAGFFLLAASGSYSLSGQSATLASVVSPSSGPGFMPNCVGVNFYEAIELLQFALIYVPQSVLAFQPSGITVAWKADSKVKGGIVIAQSVATGTAVKPKTPITLTVSAFSVSSVIDMPPDWKQVYLLN